MTNVNPHEQDKYIDRVFNVSCITSQPIDFSPF